MAKQQPSPKPQPKRVKRFKPAPTPRPNPTAYRCSRCAAPTMNPGLCRACSK